MRDFIARHGAWLLWVAALAVPLLAASDYQLFQLSMVAVYALAILGFNLVTGYNGQISLGHGAFYAVGAYVTAIMMNVWNVPYWATLPVSAVVCGAFGFLIGLPALRLGGLYLALTTFALAVATPQMLKYKAFDDWTGGVQGIVLDKPDAPFGLPLDPDQWLYVFCFLVATALFILGANLVRGRIGRALMAIRDHPMAAEAMGIDLALFKTRAFAAGAMFTGIAGSLAAVVVAFVSPDSYAVTLSLFLFVGLIVGGVASIGGAIFGAIFIEFVPIVSEGISKAAPSAVYGIILIICMYVMPSGVWGFLRPRLRRLLGAGGPPPPDRRPEEIAAEFTAAPEFAATLEPRQPARAAPGPGE